MKPQPPVERHSRSAKPHPDRREPPLAACYEVVVKCRDEIDQRRVYEQLTSAGRRCRLLTL